MLAIAWIWQLRGSDESRMTPRLKGTWRLILPSTVIGKMGVGVGLGEKMMSSVLNMLSLRCMLDIQFKAVGDVRLEVSREIGNAVVFYGFIL